MSIAGTWNVTMQTPIGTMKFAWAFTNDTGANDTGDWRGKMIGQGPVGDSELRSVQLNGEALSFETTTKTPMGPLQLTFIGTVMADSMTGTCKTKFGDQRFSAVRA